MSLKESQIEQNLINRLEELKYTYRPDIRDKTALEKNFRAKFEALNRVRLTDAEFARLRDEIINADVFQAAKILREYGYFQREDGAPLHYMLVNLRDWCKTRFEVINQLRINTDNSYHRYDVIPAYQRLAAGADRAEGAGHQPAPGHGADRRIQERPGNGYTEHAALLHAALHRQQP